MVRLMSISLPGMGLADMTTVSPRAIWMWRWSRLAMRTRAEVGSPWEPVVMMATFCGCMRESWSMGVSTFSGALR